MHLLLKVGDGSIERHLDRCTGGLRAVLEAAHEALQQLLRQDWILTVRYVAIELVMFFFCAMRCALQVFLTDSTRSLCTVATITLPPQEAVA